MSTQYIILEEPEINNTSAADNINEGLNNYTAFQNSFSRPTSVKNKPSIATKLYVFCIYLIFLSLILLGICIYMKFKEDGEYEKSQTDIDYENSGCDDSEMISSQETWTSESNENSTTEVMTDSKEGRIPLIDEPKFVSDHQVSQLKECTKHVVMHFRNIYQTPENCPKNPIQIKEGIQFYSKDNPITTCLLRPRKNCNRIYAEDKKIRVKSGQFDVFYNYILGGFGNIYEGRQLSCTRPDETINDPLPTLFIEMPDCTSLESQDEALKKQFMRSLKRLLSCFVTTKVVIHNYTMVFNSNCKNYLETENFMEEYVDEILLLKM